MISADCFKRFPVEGLRIDAYSSDPVKPQSAQLFGSYRIGSADFNRIFARLRQIKRLINRAKQRVKLLGIENARSASAEIDAFKPQPEL